MFLTVLLVVLIFWIVVGFFDTVFKTCMFHPYLTILEKSKVSIHPFQLQWHTTRWNRFLQRFGNSRTQCLQKWFGLGTIVTVLAVIPAMMILSISARSLFLSLYSRQGHQILVPVLPGVNLPLSHVTYYFMTLLVASIIHEFGHALAAVRNGVKMQGCGIFILGIFPGAFVDLSTESMVSLTAWQQLKVYCAGVWHNIVLVIVAYLLLCVNPFLLAPLYRHNSGVYVTSVVESSGASGPVGLASGDVISAIIPCDVKNEAQWKDCIVKSIKKPIDGYCAPLTFIVQEDTYLKPSYLKGFPPDCCDKTTRQRVCFHHWTVDREEKLSCLPVRRLLQQTSGTCKTSEDCEDSSWTCVVPHVDNQTRLLQIFRKGKDVMLFLGNPTELYQSVSVSNWIPRSALFLSRPAQVYETFLIYLISFSGALAILNMVPCMALDGHWIIYGIVELLLPRFIQRRQYRQLVAVIFIGIGTFLLVSNVLLGVVILMQS